MAEELYFTADAALIDGLGRELVGKQETALTELVKNSYDADATKVTVTFEPNRLVLDDDGSGMDRQELINGFLRLASDMKIRNPVSEQYRRRRAGRKGIGRFATQRLGNLLILSTWKNTQAPGLQLTINWRDFERGLALERIPVSLAEIGPRHAGTQIEISGLRDSWSETQIRRCWRSVLVLQQPFPVAPIAHAPRRDPGFKVAFYRTGTIFSDPLLVADIETEVLNQMPAVVEFRVDAAGRAEWRILRNRYGANIAWTPINDAHPEELDPPPYDHLKNAWLKAHYAVLEPSEFSPMVFPRIRELLTTEGGIRLYRNGFRVGPYGDPDDDWLRLDEVYSRRSFLFPMANRNWFGVIEVNDLDGANFEEPTSREGLIETPAFDELRKLASSVLITAARKIAEQRDRKTRAGGSSTEPTEFYLKRLREAARKAREVESSESASGDGGAAASVAQLLGEAEGVLAAATARFADEISMLQLLSTLGLAAAEFSHETGMTFQAVRLDFESVFETAKEARPNDQAFSDLVDRAKKMVDRLDALTSYLNELASARSIRQLAPVSVSRSVEEFGRGMRQLAARSEVDLVVNTPSFDGLYTKPIHKAEIASILLNFYSNSIKAMKRMAGARCILVEAKREEQQIVLRFSDTGDGILVENRDLIFDLFFSTRTAAAAGASTLEESTGTGLGLWIVRQIVLRADGTVEVADDPHPGYATTLEVRLPANEEEL